MIEIAPTGTSGLTENTVQVKSSVISSNPYCTSSIPFGLQAFNVDFASTDIKVLARGMQLCFLISRLEMLKSIKTVEILGFIPMLLDWKMYKWTNGWHEMLVSFNDRRDIFQLLISAF